MMEFVVLVLLLICSLELQGKLETPKQQHRTKKSPQFLGPKIIGGESAKSNEFPWMVYINITLEDENQTFCGGSIISEQWIVTAAHCFKPSVVSIYVVAGAYDLSINEETQQRVHGYLWRHPNFTESTMQHDIALIQVTPALTFNKNVKAISLPTSTFEAKGSATVTGWGFTNNDSDNTKRSDVLQKLTLPIISLATCTDTFSKRESAPKITDSMICADANKDNTANDPKIGVFRGDSGGPLVCNLSQNTTMVPVLCGIVSFGTSDDESHTGVYTKVLSYLDFINEFVCINVPSLGIPRVTPIPSIILLATLKAMFHFIA